MIHRSDHATNRNAASARQLQRVLGGWSKWLPSVPLSSSDHALERARPRIRVVPQRRRRPQYRHIHRCDFAWSIRNSRKRHETEHRCSRQLQNRSSPRSQRASTMRRNPRAARETVRSGIPILVTTSRRRDGRLAHGAVTLTAVLREQEAVVDGRSPRRIPKKRRLCVAVPGIRLTPEFSCGRSAQYARWHR